MHGPVRETFVELLDSLYLRRIDDAALRAEVRPLMDAPGATQLYKLRQRMALHGGAERLGLTTHIDGATQMDLALGSAPSYATPYLERWKLQLDGIAGNPARIDAAARELLEQGPSLDRAGRVRLRVLLDEHGAAARLGVSTAADLSDDRALRLWREQLAGRAATPEQAAALARTLLDQAAPLTDEQLHVLGTAVFDAGAAEALGLRTTIRQLGDASARFSGDSTANAHHQQRFANLWRAQLAGTPADPAATRAALQAVDRSGHEIGTVDRDAMLQVMLHGVDLPDAQGTATAVRDAITWPTRSGVAPLERMQQVFASPGSSGHSDIARHARIVLDRLDLPAAQADAELAQLREVLTAATRDGFEMLDDTQRETMLLSAFDHGLGPRLKLPPLPSDVTPARLFDPRFASRWRAQALLEASGMPHADRAAQLQQLATEGSGAAVDPAEFNALVQSTDSAALPAAFDAARRQRIASLLVDSGSLDPLADVHLDRARQLAADAFMPPAPPASRDEAIARMSQQLSIDAADPIARSRAHHELFDRGLLDAAVPDLPSTQRVAIEQLLEQSRTATSTVQEKLAYWKLQLDPRAAPAQFADLERAVAAGEPINAAELSRLHTILERAGQPVASARMRALLAAAQVEDISQATAWLPEAVRALDDPGAAAALRQTHDGIFELALLNMQRTLDQHPEGYLRSFANHPDYAEVGRVQSAIKLLTKLAPDHPAIDVAAQPAAVSADAAGTLVW
jgi:hypothetical protein